MLKALRRDPQARHASVGLFAADLRRYLGGHAVGARVPSLLYRGRRFVRHHRIALATGRLFAAVVGVGVASRLRQYYSIRAERDHAESVTRSTTRAAKASSRRWCISRSRRYSASCIPAAQRLQPSAEHRVGLARAQSSAEALGDAELDTQGQALRASLLRLNPGTGAPPPQRASETPR